MIARTGIESADATRRADRIYAEARSQIDVRLWRAALGSGIATTPIAGTPAPRLDVAALLGLVDPGRPPPVATRSPPKFAGDATMLRRDPAPAPAAQAAPATQAALAGAKATPVGLGVNAGYASTIADAARRTGIPAVALATIIDAEAGKARSGAWRTDARNARSTATGLGQFLAGTWKTEAQRAGTWLNDVARRNNWLGDGGTVRPEMKAPLLALRHDAKASINATADYARHSLDALSAAGAVVGTTVEEIARAAYLGHNLGIGDAIRFLNGGLDEGRAARLLDAQVGTRHAGRRIDAAGGAAAAHRGWLLDFIERHVDATRFLSGPV